jgi:signal peptidase I
MGLQFLVSGAIAIYGVIDAYRLAKRIGQNYVLRKYNRPFIYGLLLLVQGTYLAGMSAVDISRLKAFYIPSSGMAPTINNGDRIIVNKWAYLREPVRHGDVIVHQGVKNPKRRFVRRVVAVAGETIAVTNGHVRVNGSKLERTPTKTEDGQSAYTERNGAASYEILFEPSDEPPPDFAEATVPDDAVFVLGDNRNHTHDSRRFGFVPSDNVVGKVMLKYWPIGEMRKFGSFMD